jgi:hypothetical protein
MISGVIMLAASFSPDVYVSGPGSMNESLIFMFLELAPPGSNKSGMCKLFQRVLVLTAITVAMFCLLADSSRNGARAVLCWDRLLANTNPNCIRLLDVAVHQTERRAQRQRAGPSLL